MGFSPARAREALAKTSDGMDVEAALELLLGQNGSANDHDDDDRFERERARREEEERERRRRRRAGPSRDSVKTREREEANEGVQGYEADKILAQASEIGQSVLSKASLFWNSSKEKAIKVYEEQKKAIEAGEGGGRKKVSNGKPRWMVEAEANGIDVKEESRGGFKHDDEPPPLRRSTKPSRANGVSVHVGSRQDVAEEPYRSVKERADLLADDLKPYSSAARHRKPASIAASTSRAVSPAPLPSRKFVDASPSQIQASAAQKAKGNDHFKLGRFSEAETTYSAAISSLPHGHLLLVPLYNNRAATRLKLGESGGTVQDCTTVIDLVGPTYHPSKEAPLPIEFASDVKLADGLVKATIKRAQAYEMGEKWSVATEDWERVMAFDTVLLGSAAVSTRNLAAEGARRSKRMLEGVTSPVKPKSTPRPSAPQAKPLDLAKSEAVTELRKVNRAAEAEDEQRLNLKDAVDTKLLAWKGGKETNLRALIASLDTVLWDEILAGGLKVGMHELIAEKQVKIKYMKVIARLHPDKVGSDIGCKADDLQLDAKSTMLEQRMLANGAFSALNDA